MIYLTNDRVRLGLDENMGLHARELYWRGGPNLIDKADNGRGWQTDLIEGWPDQAQMGLPYCANAIDATQGGGIDNRYTGTIPTSLIVDPSNRWAFATMVPKDYCSGPGQSQSYRMERVKNKWPNTWWDLRVRYELSSWPDYTISFSYEWGLSVSKPGDVYVREVRDAIYLNVNLFHYSLDECKRDWDSWQQQEIKASSLRAGSVEAGVRLSNYREYINIQPDRGAYFSKRHLCGKFSQGNIVPAWTPGTNTFLWLENSAVVNHAWSQDFKVSCKSVLVMSDYSTQKMFCLS